MGDGRSILIGVDPIIGSFVSPYLPLDILVYLQDYGIKTLQDALNPFMGTQNYWLFAEDLGLGGSWASCWNEYIDGLKNGGIKLKPSAERILWVHNKRDGMVMTTLVYDLMATSFLDPHRTILEARIWHGSFPLKIKCFIWLALFNKILTWENLLK